MRGSPRLSAHPEVANIGKEQLKITGTTKVDLLTTIDRNIESVELQMYLEREKLNRT
jgi:hypothetical protein